MIPSKNWQRWPLVIIGILKYLHKLTNGFEISNLKTKASRIDLQIHCNTIIHASVSCGAKSVTMIRSGCSILPFELEASSVTTRRTSDKRTASSGRQ